MKIFCAMKLSTGGFAILRGAALILCALVGLSLEPVLAQQSAGMDAGAVLDHLNTAIGWYRHLAGMDASAGSPSDVLYLQNARGQALEALRLAFESAREEAALIEEESPSGAPPAQDTDRQNVARAQARVAGRMVQTRARIDALNRRIRGAGGKKRQELLSQRDALQGQLNLDQVLQEGISKMSAFMNNSENVGLLGRINALKASVPELASTTAEKQTVQAMPKAKPAEPSGLIGQTSLLLSRIRDVRSIDALLSEGARLRGAAEQLQTPLRGSLRGMLKEGQDAVNQPASPTTTTRDEMEAKARQFKRITSASLPLRQEMILLDRVRANLLEWRKSVEKEYGAILRSLLTHVFVILAVLLMVVLFSEVWRRATYRYIHEARRRRQVLILRRFVTGFLMVVVIILGFVSEFHSLATFAGFLTAGIAVALQTVILSVAAYFFLIGRYGVRVGDRITVGGVTGDVVDIGLVRMHLLELAGTGVNLFPTGRVVVFSNSVLLQASPLFKQIPGTAYTWHEAVVSLSPGVDRRLAQEKLLEAVNVVFARYKTEIERQHGAVERIIEADVPPPVPQGQLSFTDAGFEFVVRYPVEIRHAPEIDDQVMKKLIEVIEGEPDLKARVSGPPKLRSVVKG